MERDKYHIISTYTDRLKNKYYNDLSETDRWQKEVYIFAKELAVLSGHTSVCDLGTGSAYKLLHHFSGPEFKTLGVDVPKTISTLRDRYPDREWKDDLDPISPGAYDLIIASDVIEHIPDPTSFLDFIEAAKPKDIILSTPDRSLMNAKSQSGPPSNTTHVREWSFEELESYISSRFEVVKHFISNKRQKTQVIHARLR